MISPRIVSLFIHQMKQFWKWIKSLSFPFVSDKICPAFQKKKKNFYHEAVSFTVELNLHQPFSIFVSSLHRKNSDSLIR